MLTPEEAEYLSGEELPDSEVEVTVYVTFTKTIKVNVNDYRIVDEGVDEDGCYYREEDYSDCDLDAPAREQTYADVDSMEQKGWELDTFEASLNK